MTHKAYRFTKGGKWHLVDERTGKISCIRYMNADIKKAVDEKEHKSRDDKDVCNICTGMLHDKDMEEELNAYMKKCKEVSGALFVKDLEHLLDHGKQKYKEEPKLENKESKKGTSDKERRATLRILLTQMMYSTEEERKILEEAVMLLNNRWGLPLIEKETPTKEVILIKQLMLATPYELLMEFNGGTTPPSADVALIAEAKDKYELNDEVINVLIYFIMLQQDMKMSRNYFLKIAEDWKRKGIKTVKEAMDIAKQQAGKQKVKVTEK